MKRVIIDTDPGIDDAAAILLALASPELSVEAVTTIYGNGPVDQCTANAYRILHASGRLDIPVFAGAAKPLLRDPNEGWAAQVHGEDALGNSRFPLPAVVPDPSGRNQAVLEIIDRVMASPGEITILALGRLTNLALAVSIESRLAQAAAEIIVMGGAVAVPGNVSPVASANMYEDPEAAAIVYSAGGSLVQVGLDVCDQVTISKDQLDRIAQAGTAPAGLLTEATPFLKSYYQSRRLINDSGGVRYNDVPAVAFAIDHNLFRTFEFYVEIDVASPLTRGQTVAHLRNSDGKAHNARVCLEVDGPGVAELFTQRVCGYKPR